MQLKASWYDNLIAGAIFWLPQLFLAARFFPGTFSRIGDFTEFIGDLTNPVATFLVTTIVALATLILLVTGYILEMLVGTGVAYWEVETFHRHFVLNKHWVQKALQKHVSYIQADYDSLDDILGHSRIIARPRRIVRLRDIWAYVTMGIKDTIKALSAFDRLYTFMLVRTLSKSGAEPSEIIVGPLQSLRLSRLINIIFLILVLEGFIVFSFALGRIEEIGSPVALVGLMIMNAIALTSITKAFGRVCQILFALWYVVEMGEDDGRELVRNHQNLE